jgi:hypothetical protein
MQIVLYGQAEGIGPQHFICDPHSSHDWTTRYVWQTPPAHD